VCSNYSRDTPTHTNTREDASCTFALNHALEGYSTVVGRGTAASQGVLCVGRTWGILQPDAALALRLPHDTVALIIRQPETSQDGDGQDYVVKPPGFVAHGGDAGIVKGGLGKGVWPPRRPSRPIPAARIRLQVNHDHSRVITTSLNRLCRCCRHGEDRNDVRQATAATELSRCRRPPSWWKNRLLLGVRREVALSLPITSMSDACFVFETFKIQTYYECALGYPNSCAS
jgi:hypothetical protein